MVDNEFSNNLLNPKELEWSHPAHSCNYYCINCFTLSKGADDQTLKKCGQCKGVRYCSRSCQREHWSQHKGHCNIMKYLRQDAEATFNYIYPCLELAFSNENAKKGISLMSSDELEKRIGDVFTEVEYEMSRISLPVYTLRVEANELFKKSTNWKKVAKAYEKALDVSEDSRKKAIEAFDKKYNLNQKRNVVNVVWDANEARMISNLVYCYIKIACDEKISKISNGIIDDQILKKHLGHVESSSSTMATSIISLFRMSINGMDYVIPFLEKLYSKAWNACQRCRGSWWKSDYRRAQVLFYMGRAVDAMQNLETAKHKAETSDLFYDSETGKGEAIKMIEKLQKGVEILLAEVDPDYAKNDKEKDGKVMSSGIGRYLGFNFTPLPSHPRIPMSSMKEEILAVKLLAMLETRQTRTYDDGRVVEMVDLKNQAKKILDKILTSVAQIPFCLFPANGSNERSPPITIHLIAFYLRACVSKKLLEDMDIEKVCLEGTKGILTDELAYSLASHGFEEVESKHSPMRGHATSFTESSQCPCMPCTFRLLRSGDDEWSSGLRQSVHLGKIEWVAFSLNRLIEKIDGDRHKIVDVILEKDEYGCNATMHAANDNTSGYSGLSIKMMVQAVSFSTKDFNQKAKVVRKILNTVDNSGFTPAMACVSMGNVDGLAAFVELGARLWDPKTNRKMAKSIEYACKSLVHTKMLIADPVTRNLITALQTTSEERECCSYCGKSSATKLLYCSRCNRSRYCNKECQKLGYKKHKFVCTTARVEQTVDWYASNISTPTP